MAYLIVVLLSVLVGCAVYAATLRAGRERPVALGFDGMASEAYGVDPDGAEVPGPGYTYLRVATHGPSWRDRAFGFVGLIVLVSVSAAALALGIYQLGHLVNVTIEEFLAK
jgi:hypothetical protein